MKTFICYLLLIAIMFSACAQSWPLKSTYAYKITRLPGTIMVNEAGEQISPRSFITYFIYAESTSPIAWQTAWIAGKSYSVTTTQITAFPFQAGISATDQTPIFIQRKSGVKLYQLALRPEVNSTALPSNSGKGKILLRGSYKNKVIKKWINNIIDLYIEPSV
ncbi:MAG: hypothetical protein ABIT07_09005 [Ferruginibacter sp.]